MSTKASVIIELDVQIIGDCSLPDLTHVQDDISLSTPLKGHQTKFLKLEYGSHTGQEYLSLLRTILLSRVKSTSFDLSKKTLSTQLVILFAF